MFKITDLTPAQQDAMETDCDSPSQEDWDWFFENTHVDPAEMVQV